MQMKSTQELFHFKFQYEFLQSISGKDIHVTINGLVQLYTMQRSGNDQSYVVQFNSSNYTITCSCYMFDTLAWLYHHALRVMHTNLAFDNIPDKYILKRWTKGAKQGI